MIQRLSSKFVRSRNATVFELQRANIFDFMTQADRNTMKATLGADVNVDYALQALIDAGYKSAFFPAEVKGIYNFGGLVKLPSAFTIHGQWCSKPYTISGDSSFNEKGVTLRKAVGADYMFAAGSVFRIYGCNLDGRDKTRPLIDQTNQVRGGILFDCGIYRFLRGVGSYAYTSIQVGKSSICANAVGVYNLIDSRIIDCTINANSSHGVQNNAGANNNLYENVRNEWNDGIGYYFSGSKGNIITGELIDRNGSANVVVQGGGGCIISGVFSQRPARLLASGSGFNTHFYLADSDSYLVLGSVITRSGVDDGGGGTLTPERVVVFGGGSSNMTFNATGCDLTGSTLSPILTNTRPDKMSVSACIGMESVDTCNKFQQSNGRSVVGGAASRAVLSSGVGSSLSLQFSQPGLANPTTDPTPVPKLRRLLLEFVTSAGVVGSYEVPFLVRRITTNAAVEVYSAEQVSRPALLVGTAGTSGVTGFTVTISVSQSADVITVKLDSVDGVGRFIDVSIKPY